jgi:16S rRNA (cytidine1402-2'-O)-methyltransferase
MPEFFVVATPIGNLADMSERAQKTLQKVDLILCEDTRVTRKLLDHYNIKTKTQSYHQHSKLSKVNQIKEMIKQGNNIALVSDAGTPGVSDPGGKLISELVNEFGDDIKIIPIPGASAVTALLSVSGFSADKFVFMGFPPHKKGRQKFFKELANQKYTVVIYESPHRILKTLDELLSVIGERPIAVGRELTKKFETIYFGTAQSIKDQIKSKGEFVIAISAK